MTEKPEVYSRWFQKRQLGYKLTLPMTWCSIAAVVAVIGATQWVYHTQSHFACFEATSVLTGYMPEVAAIRHAVCEKSSSHADHESNVQLSKSRLAISSMLPKLKSLPEDLNERKDLIALGEQLVSLVEKTIPAADGHGHGHEANHGHGAKQEHAVSQKDEHEHGDGHSDEHGEEHEESTTLHVQNSTGFTLETLPNQIRSIDSLFTTQVVSAAEELRLRAEKLQSKAGVSSWVVFGSVAVMFLSMSIQLWNAWRSERRLSALATSCDRTLGRTKANLLRKLENKITPKQDQKPPQLQSMEKDVVAEFIDKLIEQMSRLPKAHEENQLAEVEEIARWLTGAAGTFGFDQFTLPARSLEQAVQNSEYDRLESLIHDLEQLTETVAGATSTT